MGGRRDPVSGYPWRGQEAGPCMMDLTGLFLSKDDREGDGIMNVKKLDHWDVEGNNPVFCCTAARLSWKYFL